MHTSTLRAKSVLKINMANGGTSDICAPKGAPIVEFASMASERAGGGKLCRVDAVVKSLQDVVASDTPRQYITDIIFALENGDYT